jgi:hypothetical protein
MEQAGKTTQSKGLCPQNPNDEGRSTPDSSGHDGRDLGYSIKAMESFETQLRLLECSSRDSKAWYERAKL